MRTLLALVAALGLAACAQLGATPVAETCPAVRSAEAWVNRMPGPGPVSRPLIAVVQLETLNLWKLTTQGRSSDGAILRLDLTEGGAGHPGSAGYRSETAPLPARIEIYCNGTLHHTIGEITSAY